MPFSIDPEYPAPSVVPASSSEHGKESLGREESIPDTVFTAKHCMHQKKAKKPEYRQVEATHCISTAIS